MEWCDELDTLYSIVGVYIGTIIEPIPLKMTIFFGPVIHTLGIFSKEIN